LQRVNANLVIFLDEIDTVLDLSFSVDDFFAFIRGCYNDRADHPAYNRLTFALLGVATPSDLIRQKRGTPFNIGRAIELTGLQFSEAVEPLTPGLATKTTDPQTVLREILAWTGGQPFLTQKLCNLIQSEDTIAIGKEAAAIEALVRSRVIDHWEAHDDPVHLRTIRDRLIHNEQHKGQLLGLYQQILQAGDIPADASQEQIDLRLSGLMVCIEGAIGRNRRGRGDRARIDVRKAHPPPFPMNVQEILQNRKIIHHDPDIMSGVPVFCGTRIPLQTFFDYLEGEEGLAEFISDFPYLQTQAIQVLDAIAKVMLSQERNSGVSTS
jgi:uncharacterized protein (DUF433 family)